MESVLEGLEDDIDASRGLIVRVEGCSVPRESRPRRSKE